MDEIVTDSSVEVVRPRRSYSKRQREFRKRFRVGSTAGDVRASALVAGYSLSSVDKSLRRLQVAAGITEIQEQAEDAIRSVSTMALLKTLERTIEDSRNAPHSRDATQAARLLSELAGVLRRQPDSSVSIGVVAHSLAMQVNSGNVPVGSES